MNTHSAVNTDEHHDKRDRTLSSAGLGSDKLTSTSEKHCVSLPIQARMYREDGKSSSFVCEASEKTSGSVSDHLSMVGMTTQLTFQTNTQLESESSEWVDVSLIHLDSSVEEEAVASSDLKGLLMEPGSAKHCSLS